MILLMFFQCQHSGTWCCCDRSRRLTVTAFHGHGVMDPDGNALQRVGAPKTRQLFQDIETHQLHVTAYTHIYIYIHHLEAYA